MTQERLSDAIAETEGKRVQLCLTSGRDKRLSDSETESQRIKVKEHCLTDLFNRQEIVTPERL